MNGRKTLWEEEYKAAAYGMTAPNILDEEIFSRARSYKPIKTESRTLSKAASGFTAVAVAIVLFHPAQYLGALTPDQLGHSGTPADPQLKFQPQTPAAQARLDEWYNLRSESAAGNYLALCHQWRQQQNSTTIKKLPADLADEAQQHCRILSAR